MVIKKKVTGGRSSRNPGAEVLYDLYVTQGKTATQIAQLYGVAEGTVRGWIYRANKAEREKSESKEG